MTVTEVLAELESYGNANTKKVLLKHGAQEPFWGVKVQDLKKIQKKIKKDHALALELYDTGNSDAMYLAGLIADENKITKAELNKWVKKAYWYYLSEFTVPWIAADSPHGWDVAMKWIESPKEGICAAGWATLASMLMTHDNATLDLDKLDKLLDRVSADIHDSQNRVRYAKNGFVIAVGSACPELTEKAQSVAAIIGKVSVNVGDTACKVPLAEDYIQKIIDKGRLGKKKKMARC